MAKERFTDERIAFALRRADGGTPVGEICRKRGVSEASFHRRKKSHAGMGVAEIRRLKQLEDENGKLERLVADPSLDEEMPQDALRKNWQGPRRAAPSRPGSRPPSACASGGPSRPAALTGRPVATGRAAIRGRRRASGRRIRPRHACAAAAAAARAAAPGRPGDRSQAHVSPLRRGGPVDPNPHAPASARLPASVGTGGGRRRRRRPGDGLHVAPALRRAPVPDPDRRGPPHARGAPDGPETEPARVPGRGRTRPSAPPSRKAEERPRRRRAGVRRPAA